MRMMLYLDDVDANHDDDDICDDVCYNHDDDT